MPLKDRLNDSTPPAAPRCPAGWVTLLLLGVYLLTTGGQPFISDGEIMLLTAVRIIDAQTMRLPESAALFPQVVRGTNGVLFSCYGPVQPLLAALFYWVGRYVVGWHLLPGCADFALGKFIALLLPAFATALSGSVLCRWAARLYHSARAGAVLALLFGLATLAWPYSRFFFSEPLFTLFLLLAAFALFRQRPLLAGLAYGGALATRVDGALLLPALLAYAWLRSTRPPDTARASCLLSWPAIRPLVTMIIGALPGGALVLAHNWGRFGTLADQGYPGQGFTPNLLEGIYGLLLSPGKSVFLYVPLLLALPLAALPFARRFPAEAVLLGGLTLATLLKSASWWMWWGGGGGGPRFLVPLMPFLVLASGVLLERHSWRALVGLLLVPLSVVLNLLGILVDFNDYLAEITRGIQAREAIYLYEPAHSPILAHLARLNLADVPIVSFNLSQPGVGFPEWAAPFLSCMLVVLLVGAVAGVWRGLRQPVPLRAASPPDQHTAAERAKGAKNADGFS
jgi:hypothetical protein